MTARRLLAAAGILFGMALAGWARSAAATTPTWVAPLPPPLHVLHGFAPPSSPYRAGDRGVDLVAAQGEAVRSAGDGVVGYAGLVGGKRVVTVVHDGGLRTTYEPVAASVRAGQQVRAGTVIGEVRGVRPQCAVSCLHWGLLRGDAYLDPMSLLAGPVRLLPLTGAPVQRLAVSVPQSTRPTAAEPTVGTAAGDEDRSSDRRAIDAGITGGIALAASTGWAALRRRWARR